MKQRVELIKICMVQVKLRMYISLRLHAECYSYTTGTSALPEMYARALGLVRILTGNALVPVV